MAEVRLGPNQAALVLGVSPDGEVTVDAVFPEDPDRAGDLAAALCTAMGRKLTEDAGFQAELVAGLDDGEG
jgi:hypothetical protein